MDIRSLSRARAAVLQAKEKGGEAVVDPDPGWADEPARMILQSMGAVCGAPVPPPDGEGAFWLSNGRELYSCDESLVIGKPLRLTEHFAQDILLEEDGAYSAIHLYITGPDDVERLFEEQYMLERPLCLSAATPELLRDALRVYDGRALFDMRAETEMDAAFLREMTRTFGLVVI